MRRVNPAVIPRNHQVEAAIRAAEDQGDFAPFEMLLEAVTDPYSGDPRFAAYEVPPEPHERVLKTFCGT